MTSLIPQQSDLSVHDDDTLTDVLSRVAARKVSAEPDKPVKSPKMVPVTDEARKSLRRLSSDLNALELPSERRAITETEALNMIKVGRDAKKGDKAIKLALEAIKVAVFNHLDVRLEEDNEPEDLPVDPKTGHYLVDGELSVEEAGLRFTRETRQGSPDFTNEHLLSLLEDGKITRSEYLKATRAVRVVNEEGFMGLLRSRPDLIEDLEEIIEPGKVTASFWIREIKEDE